VIFVGVVVFIAAFAPVVVIPTIIADSAMWCGVSVVIVVGTVAVCAGEVVIGKAVSADMPIPAVYITHVVGVIGMILVAVPALGVLSNAVIANLTATDCGGAVFGELGAVVALRIILAALGA
jgi:hypothetical protein